MPLHLAISSVPSPRRNRARFPRWSGGTCVPPKRKTKREGWNTCLARRNEN